MTRRNRLLLSFFCIPAIFIVAPHAGAAEDARDAKQTRPNILWITIEDWSPDLSCYGTKGIHTPHVDKLASQGIRYETAFTTSPVCSTSRSAMMTGFHQNYIGAHQHRTDDKQPLPYGIRPIPHLFADAGYYTAIMSWKTDCNFLPDTRQELFMGKDWKERKAGQPFFARITFSGTHRKWDRDPQRPIDPKDVELPPYYADTPFIRRDWANGLEQMQIVDREVGALLKRLDDEGLSDNTIVFFIGDHGRCHIRGKQFLYDEGTRIPMIMRWPGKVKPGQVNNDLVMSIDICATILEAASIKAPVPLHGKSLFSDDVKNRKYVFAARDKMDDAHDAMRSVRSKNHKLILNLMPERAYCQFSHYKEFAYPPLAEMNVLNLQGKLNPVQAAFFSRTKPEIEMFDLQKDPHEIHNIANDPAYADAKTELLAELKNWRDNVIKDQGVSDEFRAKGVFPETCPTPTVGEWVEKNVQDYDFTKNGSPPWFPTRTLAEWEKARDMWKPYVFRGPNENVPRPVIPFTKKAKKKPKRKQAAAPQNEKQFAISDDANLVFRLVSPRSNGIDYPDFFVLETEVTNRQYKIFLDATEASKDDTDVLEIIKERLESRISSTADIPYRIEDESAIWRKGRYPDSMGDHPVGLVTLHDANNFATWFSQKHPKGIFRLPTWNEWMITAYGKSRKYPWGDDWDVSKLHSSHGFKNDFSKRFNFNAAWRDECTTVV